MTWLQGMQAHNGMDKPSLGETWHSRGGIGFDCSMDLGSQVSGLGWTGLGKAAQAQQGSKFQLLVRILVITATLPVTLRFLSPEACCCGFCLETRCAL